MNLANERGADVLRNEVTRGYSYFDRMKIPFALDRGHATLNAFANGSFLIGALLLSWAFFTLCMLFKYPCKLYRWEVAYVRLQCE